MHVYPGVMEFILCIIVLQLFDYFLYIAYCRLLLEFCFINLHRILHLKYQMN